MDRIFNRPFIGAFASGSMLTLLIALIVGRLWFRHDTATLNVAGITAVFGQVIGIGLPLRLSAYGPDGAVPPDRCGADLYRTVPHHHHCRPESRTHIGIIVSSYGLATGRDAPA